MTPRACRRAPNMMKEEVPATRSPIMKHLFTLMLLIPLAATALPEHVRAATVLLK